MKQQQLNNNQKQQNDKKKVLIKCIIKQKQNKSKSVLIYWKKKKYCKVATQQTSAARLAGLNWSFKPRIKAEAKCWQQIPMLKRSYSYTTKNKFVKVTFGGSKINKLINKSINK